MGVEEGIKKSIEEATDLEQKIFQKILESEEARRIAAEFIRKYQESL